MGCIDKYKTRLLDFQKKELPFDSEFTVVDYLKNNGLYRYNTLFYFQIIPMDQNSPSTQSENENIEETLPAREFRRSTRKSSRTLETPAQMPETTFQTQSSKIQTGFIFCLKRIVYIIIKLYVL